MNPFRLSDDRHWSLDGVERPWPSDRESILAFIRRHTAADGHFEGGDLPDEDWATILPGTRFMPGHFDRVMSGHNGPEDAERHADRVIDALRALTARASASSFRRLNETLVEARLSDIFDVVQHDVGSSSTFQRDRLAVLGQILAAESPDRDAVKVGLILLGLSPLSLEAGRLVMEIGRHAEFGSYAATCLRQGSPASERAVWGLARVSTGWGRVDYVLALQHTADPDIKNWLLREGWRTGNEYGDPAAIVCARTGNLGGAMETAGDDFFDIADGLFEALVAAEVGNGSEGPADYDRGAFVVERYIELLDRQPPSFRQFESAHRLHRYVSSDHRDWEALGHLGWTAELRSAIDERSIAILQREPWEELVRAGLADPRREVQEEALGVAHRLELDVWDYWRKRVLAEGNTANIWRLVDTSSEERITEAMAIAKQRFDLNQLASGPRNERGWGPEWSTHRNLDLFVRGLGKCPGRGWDFVRAGLSCPATGSRFAAGQTLSLWPRTSWPADAEEALRNAISQEPDARLRESLNRLLRGEPFRQGNRGG